MKSRVPTTAVLTTLMLPLTIGLSSASGSAEEVTVTHQIRPSDLVRALSKTGVSGHVDFQVQGVTLSSTSSLTEGRIAEYFSVGKRLTSIAAVNFTAYGGNVTQRYVIDADGDGDTDGELIGKTDGSTDVQLTDDSSQLMKNAAPVSSPTYHGNLAAWAAAPALRGAVVTHGGFAADPIPAGAEILMVRLSYGNDAYKFTNTAPKTKIDVTGFSRVKIGVRRARVDLFSNPRPENTIRNKRLQWLVRVDGKPVFSIAQGFDNNDFWAQTFRKASGKHLVQLFKNGTRVRSFYIKTGR
jgi:hypothetical protein